MMPPGPRSVDVLVGGHAAKRAASVLRRDLKSFVNVVDGERDAGHTDLVATGRPGLDRFGVDVLEECEATATAWGVGAASFTDLSYRLRMCRNIRCLHNFEPPTTDDEVREAALQFVRKVSGSTHPSRANAAAFDQAIDEIAHATRRMLDQLVTNAPPKSRELEAVKGRQRHEKRMEREVRIRTASA